MYNGDIKFIKRIESSDIQSHGLTKGKDDTDSSIDSNELYEVSALINVNTMVQSYKLTYINAQASSYTYTITVSDMRKLYNNNIIRTYE